MEIREHVPYCHVETTFVYIHNLIIVCWRMRITAQIKNIRWYKNRRRAGEPRMDARKSVSNLAFGHINGVAWMWSFIIVNCKNTVSARLHKIDRTDAAGDDLRSHFIIAEISLSNWVSSHVTPRHSTKMFYWNFFHWKMSMILFESIKEKRWPVFFAKPTHSICKSVPKMSWTLSRPYAMFCE